MTTIDLNCDLGEGMPHDADVMPLISSANIACGGHAGDTATMTAAVTLARRHGIAIGAHPGHSDRRNFGRLEHAISPLAAATLVLRQIASLAEIAGADLHHVKLHGALYHQADRDHALAAAIVAALAADHARLVVYACAGGLLAGCARSAGLSVAAEAFVDRVYLADGTLAPRSRPDGLITDPATTAARAVRLARDGRVATIGGGDLRIHPDTLCIHGDGVNPVGIARSVHDALVAAGVTIRPATGMR